MSQPSATTDNQTNSDVAAAAVFTSSDIAAGRARAGFVFRKAGSGLWYFLADAAHGEASADQMVTMQDLLRLDPSLAQLRTMPPGCGARRAGATWQAVTLAAPKIAIEETPEPRSNRTEQLRLRTSGLAGRASALCICLGLVTGLLGGLICLTAQDAPILGYPTRLALGVPLIVAGLWTMICGFIAGAKRRPLSVALATLPFITAVALPYLVSPSERSPLALLVGAAWTFEPPAWMREAWSWQWRTITVDQAVLGGVALMLLVSALLMAVNAKALQRRISHA